MAVYETQDKLRATVQFTDLVNHLPADPTLVTFRLRDPSGNITLPDVIRTGTGAYYAEFATSVSGDWTWRWQGTGNVQVTDEGYISVRPSRF